MPPRDPSRPKNNQQENATEFEDFSSFVRFLKQKIKELYRKLDPGEEMYLHVIQNNKITGTLKIQRGPSVLKVFDTNTGKKIRIFKPSMRVPRSTDAIDIHKFLEEKIDQEETFAIFFSDSEKPKLDSLQNQKKIKLKKSAKRRLKQRSASARAQKRHIKEAKRKKEYAHQKIEEKINRQLDAVLSILKSIVDFPPIMVAYADLLAAAIKKARSTGLLKPYDKKYIIPSNPETRYRIQVARKLDEYLQQKHPNYIGVTLFGSTVKGYANEESDVDVALFFQADIENPFTFIRDPRAAKKSKKALQNIQQEVEKFAKQNNIPQDLIKAEVALLSDGVIKHTVDKIQSYINLFPKNTKDTPTLKNVLEMLLKGKEAFHKSIRDHNIEEIIYSISVLSKLFRLRVGSKRLQEYRKKALDYISQTDNPDKIIQAIMLNLWANHAVNKRPVQAEDTGSIPHKISKDTVFNYYYPLDLDSAYRFFGIRKEK